MDTARVTVFYGHHSIYPREIVLKNKTVMKNYFNLEINDINQSEVSLWRGFKPTTQLALIEQFSARANISKGTLTY